MNETWCPKLQLCYEEACDENNMTPLQDYDDYAIYPNYIVDYVQSVISRKLSTSVFLEHFHFDVVRALVITIVIGLLISLKNILQKNQYL